MMNYLYLKLVNAYSGFSTFKKLFRLYFFNPMGLPPVFQPSNPLNLFSLWKIPASVWRGLRHSGGFSHRQFAGGFGGAL